MCSSYCHQLLYDEVQWQTLSERRKCIKLNLMHRIVYNTTPTYLCGLLPNYVGDDFTYNRRTRICVESNVEQKSIENHSCQIV